MIKTEFIRPNALGDLSAETDTEMLNNAFIETADYRTLIETSDRNIVVGRRGTGKSALTMQLQKQWSKSSETVVIKITPEEHQTLGLRPKVALFGDSFLKIRAGVRLSWRYALMMEAAYGLKSKYKFSKSDGFISIKSRVNNWSASGHNIVDRFAETLNRVINQSLTPEERIDDLSKSLDLREVETALQSACDETKYTVIFLMDRLDEGYEPDIKGTALVDGLVLGAIDIKNRISGIKPIIFLRDNIFRAVQSRDPDYTKAIEGHILRLHWDTETLFQFATKRLKIAFNIQQEATPKIWNYCAGGELKGREGFKRCLQLTLYRPRDLLSLLNEAYYLASKHDQKKIVLEHIENTGRIISRNRLDDLRKEYCAILPGLDNYVTAFHGQSPEMTVGEAQLRIDTMISEGTDKSLIKQDYLIMQDGETVIQSLYSIGFVGIRDAIAGTFIFCHDGRAPDREFSAPDRILVHPCYWMALNCTRNSLEPEEAEEIYDEYDIEISSETPEIRNRKITEIITQLDTVEEGAAGASDFEDWCHKAIRICFAKGLNNVELHPNKHANFRRDVVGTNLGDGNSWRRIYDDYRTRQVIFEIKNYKGLKASDYQQLQSYLTGEYGKLGFFITRDDSVNLYSGRDVNWVRDLHAKHGVLIIKLTAKFLIKLLGKLRKPQKHDAVNDAINRLLDIYTRLYTDGQSKPKRIKKKRRVSSSNTS